MYGSSPLRNFIHNGSIHQNWSELLLSQRTLRNVSVGVGGDIAHRLLSPAGPAPGELRHCERNMFFLSL